MNQLLVTNCTTGKGGLFAIDRNTGAIRQLFDRNSRGITRGPDAVYFVEEAGAIHRLEIDPNLPPERWTLRQVGEIDQPDCHDLLWDSGSFYLVAPRGNRIHRLDPEFRLLDQFQIVPDERDVCHPNCVSRLDGQLHVTIFTLQPGPREEKRLTRGWMHEGKILRLDWDARTWSVAFEPLSQPHNLIPYRNDLYVCDSFQSGLVRVDLTTRRKTRVCRPGGFTRGLCFVGDRAYVGVSKSRRREPNRLRQWWARLRGWCGVVEYDARTWRRLRRFELPGRDVYGLLAVDQ